MSRTWSVRFAFVAALSLASLAAGTGTVAGRNTLLVSEGLLGEPGDGGSGDDPAGLPSLSDDARFAAFTSTASNLVPADDNGSAGFYGGESEGHDVFVRDLATGATQAASVDPAGHVGNESSTNPVISGDGRYVAFTSRADNLVIGDTNGQRDVFVRDLVLNRTVIVTAGANDGSEHPSISSDGRYVAFASWADNLVPGDTIGTLDVFVRDVAGLFVPALPSPIVRLTAGADGASYSSAISKNGQWVAFVSHATNLVVDDTNAVSDVFLTDWNATTPTVQRVSVATFPAFAEADGPSDSPTISAAGESVAFRSTATNLQPGDTNDVADVFVHYVIAGETAAVSFGGGTFGDGASGRPYVSDNGSYVAFESAATNLVPSDTNGSVMDVFVHYGFTLVLASVNSAGAQGAGASFGPRLNRNAQAVIFSSNSVLASGDANAFTDVYLHNPLWTCGGYDEDGPVSGPLHHTAEPIAGSPARHAVHTVSCALAGAGL